MEQWEEDGDGEATAGSGGGGALPYTVGDEVEVRMDDDDGFHGIFYEATVSTRRLPVGCPTRWGTRSRSAWTTTASTAPSTRPMSPRSCTPRYTCHWLCGYG
uniref:Agenet domain-containing protein n=1 Tax=Leersia perrieri TaxID=77586 RepID=A0A0D9V1Z7_9ORYZ